MSFRLVMALLALLACAALPAQTPAPEGSTPTAQAAPAATSAAAPAANLAGDAAAGQAKATTCAACHGLDGNPASSQYPKLAGQHESYITRQINLFKSHARDNPIMMGFAMPLSDQDMHDIGAYFASKSSLPGVADTQLVARGEALYRGGDAATGTPACMACHAADGRGNPGAGYPQLAGQFADYVSLKLKDWQAGKTWGSDDRAKIMPMIAKTLSDADVAAVSSYIEGLHSASAGGAAAAR